MAQAGAGAGLLIGAIALAAATVSAIDLRGLFPGIAQSRFSEAGIALVVLVAGQVANLVMNIVSSYHAGHQRSAFPALLLSIARLTSLVLVTICSFVMANLALMAAAFSAPLVIALAVLYFSLGRETRVFRADLLFPDQRSARSRMFELLKRSGPLMIWNICVLIVGAAGTAIVARVDFSAVVLYSFSTMFVLAVAGVDNAVLAPMLSEFSRLAVLGNEHALSKTITVATRVNAVVLSALGFGCLCICTVLTLFGYFGSQSLRGTLVVSGLVLAGIIRLTMTPMTMGFIATGTHRRVVVQPMIEAGLSLILSVSFGLLFGVVGVVLGAVLSAIVGVTLAICWSRRSAGLGGVLTGRTILSSAMIPVCCVMPILAGALTLAAFQARADAFTISLLILCALASSGLLWRFGMSQSDRGHLLSRIPKKIWAT